MTFTTLLADVTGTRDVPAIAAQHGVPMLAVRQDADGLVEADGDLCLVRVNEDGRLKVAAKPGQFPLITGDFTATAQTLALDVSAASNVVVHVKGGSVAASAITLVFEASVDSPDGSNGTWFAVQAVRSNGNTIETSTGAISLAVGSGNAYSWEASVNACMWFRVRCTARTSGTLTATIMRGSYATEPIPAIAAHAVTQSGTWSVTNTPVAPSAYSLTASATTNAAAVKTSAGSLLELSVFNPGSAAVFVKLFNKASAPTLGTDVPVLTVPVPPGEMLVAQFGATGKRFTTGIACAVTAGPAATDTAAVSAGAQIHASYM